MYARQHKDNGQAMDVAAHRSTTSRAPRAWLACLLLIAAGAWTGVGAQTADSGLLVLHADGALFFNNNEYTGSHVSGYTLPGFVLRPMVEWRLAPRFSLQGGASWLHYWGNDGFPRRRHSEVMPAAGDTTYSYHIAPWLQARADVTPWLSVVLGSLVNPDGHRLPMPLYEQERLYAVDPEAGVQLLVDHRYVQVDAWVDWIDFIWVESRRQESFNAGLTLLPTLPFGDGRWEASVPVYAIVHHDGGERLADSSATHKSRYNLAAGLSLGCCIDSLRLKAEALALRYSRTGPTPQPLVYDEWGCLRSAPGEPKEGWGAFASLKAAYRDASADISYWTSERFVPLLGNYHFSNTSMTIDDLTFDRIGVIALRAQYIWHFGPCAMAVRGAYYHYMPTTGDRKDYWKCSFPAEDMFSFGIFMWFRPTVTLIK